MSQYSQKLLNKIKNLNVIKMNDNNYKIIREDFFRIFGTKGIFINYEKVNVKEFQKNQNYQKPQKIRLSDHPDFDIRKHEKFGNEIEKSYKKYSAY